MQILSKRVFGLLAVLVIRLFFLFGGFLLVGEESHVIRIDDVNLQQ